jgi:predicted ATPase
VALALHLAGMVSHLRGDADRAALLGEEELRVSREQGFPFFLAGGLGFSGWARVCAADHEGGLLMMREGAETYRTTGAEVGIAHLAHLAEALVAAGCLEEALTVLADGLSKVEKNGERAYEAEFYRIKGLALLGLVPHETGEAASCFRLAIATARAQAARTLEARAAVDLARLVSMQGKPDEARDVLAPLRGWFTEGESCRDVRAAGELWSRVAGG